MALGLNIVVGFAGLLDLGYVAFFAIGAYTVGWLGSGFFSRSTARRASTSASSGFAGEPARHPPQLPAAPHRARCSSARSRAILIGLPTLRLRGDYIAIVTLAFGEIIGASSPSTATSITIFGEGYKLTERPPGDHAGRPDRPAVPRDRSTRPQPAARATGSSLAHRARRAVRQLPPARLAARAARGSRCARTRWRPRRWASRSCKTKLLAYATGAAFGGIAGAFLGAYFNTRQRRPVPVRLLDLHPRDGHPRRPRARSGASCSARSLLSFINNRLIPDVLNGVPGKLGLDFDLTELSFGDLRLPARDHDGAAARGPAPRAKAPAGAHRGHRGRRDRRMYEVTAVSDGRRHDAQAGDRRAADGRRSCAPSDVTKVFGGLVAVSDVSFDDRPSARSSRSSAPTAPARRRSSTCSPASTSRRRARSCSTASDITGAAART